MGVTSNNCGVVRVEILIFPPKICNQLSPLLQYRFGCNIEHYIQNQMTNLAVPKVVDQQQLKIYHCNLTHANVAVSIEKNLEPSIT